MGDYADPIGVSCLLLVVNADLLNGELELARML